MTLKIHGSSFGNEFVYCSNCLNQFSWLNCYVEQTDDGMYHGERVGHYVAICAKCRKEMSKSG